MIKRKPDHSSGGLVLSDTTKKTNPRGRKNNDLQIAAELGSTVDSYDYGQRVTSGRSGSTSAVPTYFGQCSQA
jgi:hypothetical protein